MAPGVAPTNARSEEHTSELQSLRHLVCRLLLEKKIAVLPVILMTLMHKKNERYLLPMLPPAAVVAVVGYLRTRENGWLSFFFNDTATTEIYTLSLHDALPI